MFSGIAELQPLFQKTAVRPCRSWAGARRFWKCLEALSRFAGGSGPFRRFRRCEGHFLRGSAWPLRILMGCGSFWSKVSQSLNGFFSGSESSGARFRRVFSARFWRLLPWSVDLLTLAVTRPRPGTCWPKEIWRVNLPCEVWTPEICTSLNERWNCTKRHQISNSWLPDLLEMVTSKLQSESAELRGGGNIKAPHKAGGHENLRQ